MLAEIPPDFEDELYPGRLFWRVGDDGWKSSVTFAWEANEVVPCISIKGILRITDIQYST
jgi:hypothetical protein